MIPQKIISLFGFIDYLDKNKESYIEKFIPICNELKNLIEQRSRLNPDKNYIDKQAYDIIQDNINLKFSPIYSEIYTPISGKLKELGIWSGDITYSSIWNNNISAISDFKRDFTLEDVSQVIEYKEKYLRFRTETNSNFLCLEIFFHEFDAILKVLFDFFKTTEENEFRGFETETIKVNSLQEVVRDIVENRGVNVKYYIPFESLFYETSEKQMQRDLENVKTEIIMGDKIQVGGITNNSGRIIIGKDIRISESLNDKQEVFDKIEQLIKLIRQEANISDDQRQNLITNFDKVKEEIFENKPDTNKIFKWLSNTKRVLETLVLTHDVTETINWVYKNLNFDIQ